MEDRSEVFRRPGSVDVRLVRGTFDPTVVGDRQAFTLVLDRNRTLLLTEALVRMLRTTGATSGTSFVPVGVIPREGGPRAIGGRDA